MPCSDPSLRRCPAPARSTKLKFRRHAFRSRYPRVLPIQIQQRHLMHLRRRKPAFPESETGVLHQIHGEPQITTGAHGGFYRIVGNHAAYKNARSPGGAQPFRQIRAGKRIASRLAENRFVCQRSDLWLEIMQRLTRAILRIGATPPANAPPAPPRTDCYVPPSPDRQSPFAGRSKPGLRRRSFYAFGW